MYWANRARPHRRVASNESTDATTRFSQWGCQVPELRQNMATKEWVVIATERAKRPEQFVVESGELTEERPQWDAKCPFCPGNEEPSLEIERIPAEGPWQVRVIRNKFAALDRDGERTRSFDGVNRRMSGVGYHEVLVESPLHNTCPGLEPPEVVALMMKTFQRRGRVLAKDPRIEHLIYFKNHGERAGTSLAHPHTQMIGLPMVPQDIRARTEEARRYFDDTGECVFCRMVADELKDGSRIVEETDRFAAFVPFAAPSPFHTWIVPRRHEPSFLAATEEEMDDLGRVLRRVLGRLYEGLHDPDYNYVIRSSPVDDAGQDHLHWYVTLIPRVTRTAGFELGSGMYINTALPEASAAFLREPAAKR
jgi:UDPglucose--hexose-1-phosphate uridylyltransferase